MSTKHYYTDERNAQIVIALLKAHGIRDLVISPGGTNSRFALSVQGDSDFQLYSAIDERHAAYLACGIAEESGRPVVICCTGATASRNYMSGLTEAYYRKLPILAITCSQIKSHLGNLYPQMTDRYAIPNDIVRVSVQCPIPHTNEEERYCELEATKAILALTRHGGGPAHINLETSFCRTFSVEVLPKVRKINCINLADSEWPQLDKKRKIIVWIGSHRPFSESEKAALELFSQSNDAVVLGDLTSNFTSPVMIHSSILCYQKGSISNPEYIKLLPDLIIYIGEISGDYATASWLRCGAETWRVSIDGEIKDFFGTLSTMFEMPESMFFLKYAENRNENISEYRDAWKKAIEKIKITSALELPFSGLYIAKKLSERLNSQSKLHLGILNPLRCFNFFPPETDNVFCNVGGFGIDGNVSSLIGASLVNKNKLYYCVVGDLSFFYDLNSIGNRHVGNNIRILIVNNGEGGEFSIPGTTSDLPYCGEKVHEYIAARGHFGNQSRKLVKNYAEDLNFYYLTATCPSELDASLDLFCNAQYEKSIILECFTSVYDDRTALEILREINPYVEVTTSKGIKSLIPDNIKKVVKIAVGK